MKLLLLQIASFLTLLCEARLIVNEAKFQAEKEWFVQGVEFSHKPDAYPFQYPEFGAQKSWKEIHHHLDKHPKRVKLLYLIRHGQGVHNLVSSLVGQPAWDNTVAKQCYYQDFVLFDPVLTDAGFQQCSQLNDILKQNDTLSKLITGKEMHFKELTHKEHPLVLTSPLTRTSQTAIGVFNHIPVRSGKIIAIEELRESTVGGHTCDSRRSLSDPPNGKGLTGNCAFTKGYETLFGEDIEYPMKIQGQGIGMFSDEDELFSQDHPETANILSLRAARFVETLYDNFPEVQVVFAVAHGGIISAIMQTLGLQQYNPSNAELIPIMLRDMRH
jgi:broad specificity phosphatase PhoE